MKFNCYFTIRGSSGESVEAPATSNPFESPNLDSLLTELAGNLPMDKSLGIETIGIRVEMEK